MFVGLASFVLGMSAMVVRTARTTTMKETKAVVRGPAALSRAGIARSRSSFETGDETFFINRLNQEA